MAKILKAFKLTKTNPKATSMAIGLELRKRYPNNLTNKAYKK